MEMEPVSDVKAIVTGDAETESVDYDVTGDAEIDSISRETETESVSSEIDTESLEDMTENESLYHINFDFESPLSTPVSDAANEVTTLKTVRANLAAKKLRSEKLLLLKLLLLKMLMKLSQRKIPGKLPQRSLRKSWH